MYNDKIKLNKYSAVTTKVISGAAIKTVPIGTKFFVWRLDNKKTFPDWEHVQCEGLSDYNLNGCVMQVYNYEYKIIKFIESKFI